MEKSLQACRENFGPPGRTFSFWERLFYLRVKRPRWCSDDDELSTFFRHKDRLLENGVVVWGHIVQANRLLFSPGRDNCPGEVVYVPNTKTVVDPEELSAVASKLFDLKGTEPDDPGLASFARYLTDEMIRVYGLRVPSSVSPRLTCAVSTVFFARHHLPERRLCSPLLPIIVNLEKPRVVMPLPARYWPAKLIQWWSNR